MAVETGTTQQTDAEAQSTKCKGESKPAVKVLGFPDQSAANLALTSGRADVGMADSPVAAYTAKQSGGKLEVVGRPTARPPTGSSLPETTAAFAGLLVVVLGALKASTPTAPTEQILQKWGHPGRRDHSNFAINPPAS